MKIYLYILNFQRQQRAERLGNLCAFYENVVPDPSITLSGGQNHAALYVTLQSAYNEKWYLGFGPNPLRKRRFRQGKNRGRKTNFHRGIIYTRDGYKATLPRKMAKSQKKHKNLPGRVNTGRCDFRFYTGSYSPHDVENEWKGLFEHILKDNGANIKIQKRNITKTANTISNEIPHKKKVKLSNLKTNLEHVASKRRRLNSQDSYHANSHGQKKNVKPISLHDFNNKEKLQSDQIKNIANTLTETRTGFQTNITKNILHDKFDNQHFGVTVNRMKEDTESSNDADVPSPPFVNVDPLTGLNKESLLSNDDIISNVSLISHDGNSQKIPKSSASRIQNNSGAVPLSTSRERKKAFQPLHNARNKKISSHTKSDDSAMPKNQNIDTSTGADQLRHFATVIDSVPSAPLKVPKPAPREGSIEITGPRVSPTVSASQRNVLNKRKKLLRRIRISMLNQQKVVTSKGYAFRNKMNLKGSSKHDRTRLREKQLRSRYLRHRERPVNSYLYVHNKPKKARLRLSSLKSTVSPKAKH